MWKSPNLLFVLSVLFLIAFRICEFWRQTAFHSSWLVGWIPSAVLSHERRFCETFTAFLFCGIDTGTLSCEKLRARNGWHARAKNVRAVFRIWYSRARHRVYISSTKNSSARVSQSFQSGCRDIQKDKSNLDQTRRNFRNRSSATTSNSDPGAAKTRRVSVLYITNIFSASSALKQVI